MYIHICIYTHNIYIYRERERERERFSASKEYAEAVIKNRKPGGLAAADPLGSGVHKGWFSKGGLSN